MARFSRVRFKTILTRVYAAIILPLVASAGSSAGAGARSSENLARLGPGVSNHPMSIRPSSLVTIPDDWPLGERGTITCLTCHTELPEWGADAKDPKLRGFDLRDRRGIEMFCSKCHSRAAARGTTAAHWMGVPAAHVSPEKTASLSYGTLDGESKRCLQCHDGFAAGEAGNPVGNQFYRGGGDAMRNHVIGVRYRTGRYRTELTPSALLPKTIRLPGGTVGCVSCHDLYAGRPKLLAVSMERSALCRSCHPM